MRFHSRKRPAVSSIVGSIFFVLIMVVAIASLVTIFNSFTGYNQQVNKASNANLQAANTQLSVTGGQFGAFPPSTTSNFNVATNCATTSTQTTNTGHLFYAANMWWDFFTGTANCGTSSYEYSTSFDGVTWQAATSIPGVLTTGYTVGPYWNIDIIGTTIYLVIAEVGASGFQLGIGTLSQGGTNSAPAGTISWTSSPATVATSANVDTVAGPIQIEVDSSSNTWVTTVQGATTIGVYERQACASGTSAADGWAPNACSSGSAPTNYQPAGLTGLSANANMIMMAAPSTLSATGVAIIYETGGANVPSTGSLGLLTASISAGVPAFNPAISMASLTFDYSLTSSSAAWVSNTIYFAGLAGTAANDNTCTGGQVCTLRFWTSAFTSMTAATISSDASGTNGNPIQSTSQLWEAALTASGATLALFDSYPTSTAINYYTSGTLGSIWSSAISLESAETAVNGLNAASSGVLAVTWASASGANSCGAGNTGPCVRFAALSTFTLSNSSPFSVHVVDLYVYNPATNAIVAHWYFNTTGTGAEDFDWWVGQGATTSIPVRFIWAAATSYLITFSTDAGVTAQTTLTTLPGGTVSCPTGQFFNEISPFDACGSAGTTNPLLVLGEGEETCTTNNAAARMMGLALSYTTSSITSGNLHLAYDFQVASEATTAGDTATWQLYYGTGTAPTCNTATPAGATSLGELYTVSTAIANSRRLSQSVTVTISGLSASTTYWFDISTTPSNSAHGWTFSNPDGTVIEPQTTNSPTFATSTNANSCTTNSAGPKMMGFGTTFTTPSTGFSGTVFGKLTFGVSGTGAATSTTYLVTWNSGASIGCNLATGGNTVGNTYTITSQNGGGAIMASAQKAGFLLTGLTAGTTYWVDVQATTTGWTYSKPTLAVTMLPSTTGALPAASSTTTTNTCTGNAANTYQMMGFGSGATPLDYTIPSSATGNLYVSLTFDLALPATSGSTTSWEIVYEGGVSPGCNTPLIGTPIGNTYTVSSQSGTNTGAITQSETIVIQDIQRLAGHTVSIDVVAYSSITGFHYYNPEISVADFPA